MKFGIEHPLAHWLRFRKNPFEGPFEDLVLDIKGSYFGLSGITDSLSGKVENRAQLYTSGLVLLVKCYATVY